MLDFKQCRFLHIGLYCIFHWIKYIFDVADTSQYITLLGWMYGKFSNGAN